MCYWLLILGKSFKFFLVIVCVFLNGVFIKVDWDVVDKE